MTDIGVLRHFLATIAYRTHVACDGAPKEYWMIRISEGVRTPLETLNHMSDVLALGYSLLTATPREPLVNSGQLDDSKKRFDENLKRLDDLLVSDAPISEDAYYRFIQGPVSDVLTHVGQLATMRRISGTPISEHIRYSQADVRQGNYP